MYSWNIWPHYTTCGIRHHDQNIYLLLKHYTIDKTYSLRCLVYDYTHLHFSSNIFCAVNFELLWQFDIVAGILEMSTATENIRFSGHTLDKATKAKVTLENYYSNLIAQHIERKQRYYLYPQSVNQAIEIIGWQNMFLTKLILVKTKSILFILASRIDPVGA